MVSAYQDNVALKTENKRLSSTVEELYLRNISNLQLLFGKDFDTRWSSEFDARLEDWLQRYMDAVMFEDKEGHRQLFDSESMQEEDPFWRDRGKLTGFLMAAAAAEQRAEQAKAEIGIGGDLHAVELFALTKNYDVIAATLYIHRSGGHELIVRIEQ